MIIEIFQIFRARHNKALASQLAVRLAQGQLLDRATAPLFLVHIGLWTVSIISGALALALLVASETIHSALGFVAIIPLVFCLVPAWISLRLKSGLDRIKDIAASYSDAQLERLFPQDRPRTPAPDLKSQSKMPETAPPDNPANTRDAP